MPAVDLQVFRYSSFLSICAAVNAVVYEPSITNKGLLVNKSQIFKKDVTIPRLELISAYMGSNLVSIVLSALKTEDIRSVVGWADSTVVLCWFNKSESYKPFAPNRVSKIKQHDYIKWQYVPTKQNPAFIGSRGSLISKLPKEWWEGPSWLTNSSEWPNQPVIQPLLESQKEAKLEKQIIVNTIEIANAFDKLLGKYESHNALRVSPR